MIRKAIRQAFKVGGFKTSYHVSATYPTKTGTATLSMTVTIRPWLNLSNYMGLIDLVKSEADSSTNIPTNTPNIVCVTKLGI